MITEYTMSRIKKGGIIMESAIARFLDYLQERIDTEVKREVKKAFDNTDVEGIAKSLSLMENRSFSLDDALMSRVDEVYGNLDKEKVEGDIFFAYKIVKILSMNLVDLIRSHEFFDEFELLSKYLLESPLRVMERFQVILFMIEKNIAAGILMPNTRFVNSNDSENFSFDDNLLYFSHYENFSPEDDISKMNNDKKLVNETDNLEQKLIVYKRIYRTLTDHYLSKTDSFSLEDIEPFCLSLKELGISEILIGQIKYYLKKTISKRKTTERSEPQLKVENEVKTSKYLSDKEYRTLKKKICQYFDMHQCLLVRPLSDEELCECAIMMAKIGVEEDVLKALFMRYYQQESVREMNMFAKYSYFYDKLLYYAEKKGYQSDLEFINDCINEMMIASEEDYSFWKEEFTKEAQKLYYQVADNYEYEVKKAKKKL